MALNIFNLLNPYRKEVQLDRSVSEPCGSTEKHVTVKSNRSLDEPLGEQVAEPIEMARELLNCQERIYPYLFGSLKSAIHPLIGARYGYILVYKCKNNFVFINGFIFFLLL